MKIIKVDNVRVWIIELPKGQGITINRRNIIVKPVRFASGVISIDDTIDVIQHEIAHTKVIERLGWTKFVFTILLRYIIKGHSKTEWEEDARIAETLPNPTKLREQIINYCIESNQSYL